MFTKTDQFLIELYHKNRHNSFGKLAHSKWGFALTSFFVLFKTILEAMEEYEHGKTLMAVVFYIIAALIALYSIMHLFREWKIERFEYRLKVFEALILLYIGCEKWLHIGHEQGYLSRHPMLALISSLTLVFFYLMHARLIYLKHKGAIGE